MRAFNFIIFALIDGKASTFTKSVEAHTSTRAWIDLTTRLGSMFNGTNTTVYKIELETSR